MSEQKHLIKRQVIEFTHRRSLKAQQLQADISRVYRQRIIPLIDRYCTEVGEPDRLYRIECLEVDLGVINTEDLEVDLVAKVSKALLPALKAAIGSQEQGLGSAGQHSKAASQLELLVCFARTGSLPWWADASQPRLLDNCLQDLLRHTPDSLRRVLRALVQEPHSLQRIVCQFDDARLAEIFGLLVPAFESVLIQGTKTVLTLLQSSRVAATCSPTRIRQSTWRAILHVAVLGGPQYDTPEALYRAVLKRVAADVGTAYDALIADIQQIVDTDDIHVPGEFKDTLGRLSHDHSREQPPVSEKMSQQWTQLMAAGGILAGVAEAQRTLAPADYREMLTALSQLAVAAGLSSSDAAALIKTFRAARQEEPAPSPPSPAELALDSSFSDADELYIENAGLVILWPFLGHFFAHVGLLEKKQFKDAAARQRAAGLLQYLATGEASFPEYLLPLNKVLCGMEVTEVFDFGAPLAETEAEECTNLLSAVIAQAPILREMSLSGFRGSFLLRHGVLSTRDGAWLLRVERETYDVVLERFPWSWEWIKLPWMDAPMRVEWL